jgi:hypothetical protein
MSGERGPTGARGTEGFIGNTGFPGLLLHKLKNYLVQLFFKDLKDHLVFQAKMDYPAVRGKKAIMECLVCQD